MCSKLSCHQIKMDCFIYEMFYIRFMVFIKQKPRIDSQTIKKGESEDTTMENNQFTKEGRNRGKKRNNANIKQQSTESMRWEYFRLWEQCT